MKIVGQLKAILGLDKSKFDAGLKSAEKGASTFGKSLKAIFASAGLALGIKELIRFGLESAKLAAKAEGVRAAFDRLNSPTLLQDLRRATKNTVSDVQLMTNAIRASNFRLPLEQLPKYFEFATRRARETGDSVNYLVDSIVLGISRESPKILDNLGLSLSEINEELKHTPDYATAVGNIIERELKKAGDAADDAGVKFMQFSAAWEGFKEGAGDLVNKTGLPNLLQRWSTQMRILGDESMTASQKLAMLFATRIDKGAYNNYLEHLNRLSKGVKDAYNPAAGAAASLGIGTGFNMFAGIEPKQITTLQTLTDEIASLEEMMMGLSITQEDEIRSVLKDIEAKKKQIDAIMGVGEAVKKTTREIQDAQQVWGEMVKPEQMALGNIAYSKGDITTAGTGGMSQLFANPKELAKTQENLNGLGDAYDDVNNRVMNLAGTITDVFYGALTSDDGVFKSIGESLKRLAAQFAATAMAAAVLAFAISMIPGLGQIAGVEKGAKFGDIFGKILKGGLGLGMASGGEIPGGYPNDTFPAMLSSGETVLTARQSQWLKDGIKVNVTGIIRNKDLSLTSRRSNYSN